MEARVITLFGNEYSERVAKRCMRSARDVGGIEVRRFPAVTADDAPRLMRGHGLEWTWNPGTVDRRTGLRHHDYGGNTARRVACAMSHFLLWKECAESGQPLMVLEHDAVFIRPFTEFVFKAVCQINDPRRATPKGAEWSDSMAKRGPGVYAKTKVLADPRPDGLAGNSAYVIRPSGAERVVELAQDIGLWPNDALICRQLVPNLEEHYPFITEVRPEMSTI